MLNTSLELTPACHVVALFQLPNSGRFDMAQLPNLRSSGVDELRPVPALILNLSNLIAPDLEKVELE